MIKVNDHTPKIAGIMIFAEHDRSGAVTLSAAKGLSRWVQRCFAEFTLSAAKGSA